MFPYSGAPDASAVNSSRPLPAELPLGLVDPLQSAKPQRQGLLIEVQIQIFPQAPQTAGKRHGLVIEKPVMSDWPRRGKEFRVQPTPGSGPR